jgi:hypothetical protein
MTPFLATESIGRPPVWSVLPFAGYLLAIAVVPLFLGRFWEKNRNKLIVAIAAGIPAAGYLLSSHGGHLLLDSLGEYLAFIALLASLFIISGAARPPKMTGGTVSSGIPHRASPGHDVFVYAVTGWEEGMASRSRFRIVSRRPSSTIFDPSLSVT